MNQHGFVPVRRRRWGRLAAIACLSIGLCASGAVALSSLGPTGRLDPPKLDQARQLEADIHPGGLAWSEAPHDPGTARAGANDADSLQTLQLADAGQFDAAGASALASRYRDKVLCIAAPNQRRTGTTIVNDTPRATRNCQTTVPLGGISVDQRSRTVRFGTAGRSFEMPAGATLSCEDPDGDFEHCNGVCSSTPGTQESGSTGCSLGCLAAYIWDKSWC